jgi:hypothetical protein
MEDDPKTGPSSICGRTYTKWGRNAWPINDGTCCAECDDKYVIPRRLADVALAASKPAGRA